MSFSTEFTAYNKIAARSRVASESLPNSVRLFLLMAIENLKDPTSIESDVAPIYVKAIGHLCDSPNAYENTTAAIEVRRITLIPMPMAKKVEPPGDAGPSIPAEQTL